jgi:transposase
VLRGQHAVTIVDFHPAVSIQELRALTRTRKQLVREKVGHVQRIQKTLEDTNIKIASVVSDLMGVSGRAILEALIAGETDPDKLADLTRGRLKASHSTIVESLRGRVTANHRFLLKLHFGHVETIEELIATVAFSTLPRVGARLAPADVVRGLVGPRAIRVPNCN